MVILAARSLPIRVRHSFNAQILLQINMTTPTDRSIAIDALRGFAAIMVLLLHAREEVWVGISSWLNSGPITYSNPDILLGFLSIPFRYGFIGVPLFFVISGYCIHRPNAHRRNAQPNFRLNLRMYAWRRITRIYPVFIAAMLLTVALDAFSRHAMPDDTKLGNVSVECFAVNALSLTNIVSCSGMPCPPLGSNSPLWTLPIEIHFYAVYPILFLAFGRFPPWLVLVGSLLVSSIVIIGMSGANTHLTFFLPFWFCWTVGAYIAELEVTHARPSVLFPVGVTAVLAAVTLITGGVFSSRVTLPELYSFLAIPAGMLVWLAVCRPLTVRCLMPLCKVFAGFGVFSYSLYATHVPVLICYRAIVQHGDRSRPFYSVMLACLAAVAVGLLMYLTVEQWTIQPASRKRMAVEAPPVPNCLDVADIPES